MKGKAQKTIKGFKEFKGIRVFRERPAFQRSLKINNKNYERNMDVPSPFRFYRLTAYLAGKPEEGKAKGHKRRALGLPGALRRSESIN